MPHTNDTHVLPERPIPLCLELTFPLSCLASIQHGYESQGQEEKWSIYYWDSWVQIWRPSLTGLYCYAVRLEETDTQRLRVAESWVGYQVLTPEWFGPDLAWHRNTVIWLLEGVAGFSGERFSHQHVSGCRLRKKISFSGAASSIDEVNEIAKNLRTEFAQMAKDGW